ncbi:hypothetical protein KJ885_04315 [Patescibacteria group bacterium]|nr:hypothetical protein [Patescibacteria group bacterium]
MTNKKTKPIGRKLSWWERIVYFEDLDTFIFGFVLFFIFLLGALLSIWIGKEQFLIGFFTGLLVFFVGWALDRYKKEKSN